MVSEQPETVPESYRTCLNTILNDTKSLMVLFQRLFPFSLLGLVSKTYATKLIDTHLDNCGFSPSPKEVFRLDNFLFFFTTLFGFSTSMSPDTPFAFVGC